VVLSEAKGPGSWGEVKNVKKQIFFQSTTMTSPSEFDILNSPLEGRNLIEASAGTGKTHAISRIFLRLLLEKPIELNKILAVTFTEAATEELRRRIRLIIVEAKQAFETGKTEDPLLAGLLARCDTTQAIDRLHFALRDFDTVAVFTVHGFCSRVLYDNAFECNQTFDAEVITDQADLFQEVVDDFWRRHFLQASPLFVAYALESKITPASMLYSLKPFCGRQLPRIEPVLTSTETVTLERAFYDAFKELGEAWNAAGSEVESLLRSPHLDGRKYRSGLVSALVIELAGFLKSSAPSPLLFENFEKLTRSYIAASARKDQAPIAHSFFDLCESLKSRADALCAAYANNVLFLKSLFLTDSARELAERKDRRNVLYFDDLLSRVDKALRNNGNQNRLADVLRKKYQAGLIDEFQDIDPVQYAIFSAIFPAGSLLFIIGDPKQAIYSFRGADIFAYLNASKNVDRTYTLSTNHRSAPALVSAINSLFGNRPDPFVFKEITYKRVSARLARPGLALAVGKSPFTLWMLSREGGDGVREPISKTAAAPKIARGVANEISLLIGQEKIAPSHIAVAVRTNKEAQLVHDTLVATNIPAIIESAGSVFGAAKAVDMYRLLLAIQSDAKPPLRKAALATCFFGFGAADIDAMSASPEEWDKRIAAFAEYRELWHSHGFFRMMRAFMARENVRGRLLTLPLGDRILTNILHLTELIHKEESRRRMTPGAVCAWIAAKIAGAASSVADEEMIRLESDENAVRVTTIHKSKGLEYPIVFCPFSWGGSELPKNRKNAPFLFHDPDNGHATALALGPEAIERNRPFAQRELLAENVRLLYVALTRAKFRCYCVWGMISSAETSALAHVLHDGSGGRPASAMYKGMSDADLSSRLAPLAQSSGGAIEVVPMQTERVVPLAPSEDAWESPVFKAYEGTLPQPWGISSFSSLTRAVHFSRIDIDFDVVDNDEAAAPEDESVVLEGMHAFPRGARTGVFLHDVLEHVDFAKAGSPDTAKLVERKLLEHGFALSWAEHAQRLIFDLARAPLAAAGGAFSLGAVPAGSMVREMEFYFPLKRTTTDHLEEILTIAGDRDGSRDLGGLRLEFSPVRGFMKGFIDCVFEHEGRFYVIDWKSNFLGGTRAAYGPAALKEVMARQRYTLQYHLYLLAVHSYLSRRMPGYDYKKNFGGVFYIFLRGIGPAGNGRGVYCDRPDTSVVTALEGLIDRGA
jgi:exodeoxyribonuclease V beta subunit